MHQEHGRQEQNRPNLDTMVAIASGTAATVERWTTVLTGAAIRFAIARTCDSEEQDYAELWVERGDADDARTALRQSNRPSEHLIW